MTRYEHAVARLQQSEKFLAWNSKPQIRQMQTCERHYSPAEIGRMWGISTDFAREVFQNEPGVLRLGSNGTKHTRKYKTLRVPESVLERVYTRLSAVPAP